MTIDNFISRANLRHKNKYDYSLMKSAHWDMKYDFICPKHGVFSQTTNNHLFGGGCPFCSKENRKSKKLTIEKFIKRAQSVHGNTYDYSLVDYKNNRSKVKILCRIHGVFEQTPNDHLNGYGCKKCGIESSRNKKVDTIDNFIHKSNNIHNYFYDYSLSVYINNHSKVKIICPIHGVFEQLPNAHLSGQGCPICGCEKVRLKLSFTNDDFIKKAVSIHGNKYDYSLVNYINALTNVEIICKKHGSFKSTPGNHTHKKNPTGCPICKLSKGELKIINFLEKNNIVYKRQKKFKDCRYLRPLPFDFYLPYFNTCVEYDGEQHFKSVKPFGGIKGFIKQKIKDKIKTDYCHNNGICLLRINHKDNIECLLTNFLNCF